MTVENFLHEVRAKIARGFCKEQFAEDAVGNPVDVSDKRAVAFCIMGAVYSTHKEISDPYTAKEAYDLERRATEAIQLAVREACATNGLMLNMSIPVFNDWKDTEQQDALDILTRASEIANAQA